MFKNVRDLMLYGGLEHEQYERVRDDATVENLRGLSIYAPIASIVFCVLLVVGTMAGGIPAQNIGIYTGSCVATGIIAICAHLLGGKSARAVHVLVHMLMCAFYVFGIGVSMMHPELPAVSAIVFLLVTPLLFVCRPMTVSIQTVLAIVATCIASTMLKSGEIALDDVWNAVTYGIVGIVTNIFLMRTKFRTLYQAWEIEYLSETDVLTGLKNRNCYENRLEDYPRGEAKLLVCAYADADGLHTLNNTKGHDAGDALLCAIAHAMQGLFGEEHTYRIGGDEFVAFVPNGDVDGVRAMLAAMREELMAQGHRLSVGAASTEAATADMRSLVRAAEKEMYAQKFASGAGGPREN